MASEWYCRGRCHRRCPTPKAKQFNGLLSNELWNTCMRTAEDPRPSSSPRGSVSSDTPSINSWWWKVFNGWCHFYSSNVTFSIKCLFLVSPKISFPRPEFDWNTIFINFRLQFYGNRSLRSQFAIKLAIVTSCTTYRVQQKTANNLLFVFTVHVLIRTI